MVDQDAIDVVVLAGGKASRMGDLCRDIPKPFLPVSGHSFTLWTMQELARSCPRLRRAFYVMQGTRTALLADIKSHLPVPAFCISEESPMGTGGAILNARVSIPGLSDPFLVLNGDVLFPMRADELLAEARHYGAAIQAIEVPDPKRFGTLEILDDKVVAFREKTGQVGAGWINAGLYAFTQQCLAGFPVQPCSFETDIAPALVATESLGLVKTEGNFLDIGTREDYIRAEDFIDNFQFNQPLRQASN